MNLAEAIESLQEFTNDRLTQTVATIESELEGRCSSEALSICDSRKASSSALRAAFEIKRASAQINTSIHALGILRCLPHILESDEIIEYLSLGAGNTNRSFDLQSDRRVVEFKFIQWQGGSEAIRQDSLFKDFVNLAEYETHRRKQLCVVGLEHPLRFLKARRSLGSVCSRSPTMLGLLKSKYPSLSLVSEYYELHSPHVQIVDVSHWLPELLHEPEQ